MYRRNIRVFNRAAAGHRFRKPGVRLRGSRCVFLVVVSNFRFKFRLHYDKKWCIITADAHVRYGVFSQSHLVEGRRIILVSPRVGCDARPPRGGNLAVPSPSEPGC